MALTRIVKGKEVKISAREVKQTIMKANNWTAEEYKKKYDIFKNKLRAFEAYEKVSVKQSPVELLYKQAKAKMRDKDYKPSIKMRRIQDFTSISSGKKLQEAMTHKRYLEARTATYTDATYLQFRGLIENNSKAEEIYETIKDPVKREKALADFANKIKAAKKENDERVANEAIPVGSGEAIGSPDFVDFDLTPYLD